MTTTTKSWWKPRARFTLRALLVAITLFMLWGGYHTNRGRAERSAEALLRRRGASFNYGPTLKGKSIGDRIAWCYSKIVQAVWQERFITHAWVYGSPTPEEVDALCNLRHLECLTASPGKVTREEAVRFQRTKVVEGVAKMPTGSLAKVLAGRSLKGLVLERWELSDEDCEAIGTQREMLGLNLFGSKFSEEGLTAIVQLPRLKRLWFNHCRVTGAKLRTIPGSTSLEWVDCVHTPVGNDLAALIGRSSKIKYLSCYDKTIDDTFITAIGPHPSLEALDLGHSVTDASVTLLQKLPSLKSVTIRSPGVSEGAKDRLKKHSPTLIIH